MRLPRPRSLAAQMAVLIGAALLVAQLVNFGLILNDRQRLSLAQTEGPAIERFANIAADVQEAEGDFRAAVIQDSSHRGARISLQAGSGVPEASRRTELEAQLDRALAEAGAPARQVRAADEAEPVSSVRNAPASQVGYIRLAAQSPDGQWLVGRMSVPKRDPWLLSRLIGATAALYLIVLGAAIWLALRLVRPLRDLTGAAERFAGRGEPEVVAARGPADLRQAIAAFNAMNVRLASLLDEKDRMLGALGHDLRTPLASLRLRIEAMEPEAERAAAVIKIEEMSAMLEDILALARTGRARQMKPLDVTALAEAVAQDFADQGRPVSFGASPRLVAEADAGLLRRAVTNLLDNALAYAGEARVSVALAGEGIEIRVEDDGPGVPADSLEDVLRPFHRLEGSRSRETGGAGLGLAIVRGVAEGHGGVLRLENRIPHGLAAVIVLPAQ